MLYFINIKNFKYRTSYETERWKSFSEAQKEKKVGKNPRTPLN